MFKRAITDLEIAKQISSLLSQHNNLGTVFTPEMIMAAQGDYIVQTIGPLVAASLKIERQSYNMTEIKHMVVHPSMRKRGLAKILILSGIKQATTPLIYATTRGDNIASCKALQSCGLKHVGQYTTGNRNVLLYMITGYKYVSPTTNILQGG